MVHRFSVQSDSGGGASDANHVTPKRHMTSHTQEATQRSDVDTHLAVVASAAQLEHLIVIVLFDSSVARHGVRRGEGAHASSTHALVGAASLLRNATQVGRDRHAEGRDGGAVLGVSASTFLGRRGEDGGGGVLQGLVRVVGEGHFVVVVVQPSWRGCVVRVTSLLRLRTCRAHVGLVQLVLSHASLAACRCALRRRLVDRWLRVWRHVSLQATMNVETTSHVRTQNSKC